MDRRQWMIGLGLPLGAIAAGLTPALLGVGCRKKTESEREEEKYPKHVAIYWDKVTLTDGFNRWHGTNLILTYDVEPHPVGRYLNYVRIVGQVDRKAQLERADGTFAPSMLWPRSWAEMNNAIALNVVLPIKIPVERKSPIVPTVTVEYWPERWMYPQVMTFSNFRLLTDESWAISIPNGTRAADGGPYLTDEVRRNNDVLGFTCEVFSNHWAEERIAWKDRKRPVNKPLREIP